MNEYESSCPVGPKGCHRGMGRRSQQARSRGGRRDLCKRLPRRGAGAPNQADHRREYVRKNYGTVEVLRVAADGDTTWSEVDWSGTRPDGSREHQRGVHIFGVRDGQIAWGPINLESVEEDGIDLDERIIRMAHGDPAKAARPARSGQRRSFGMARTKASVGGLMRLNGADIYHEVRGAGPSVLLIHGGGSDSGTLARLADHLARDFMVVAYDRRGLSRSPRPKDWQQTSIAEQAEDAAALLRALGVAPAAVVGASLGALIALELLLQHPDLVWRASLLDPGPSDSAIPDRRERMVLPEPARAAMARGDSEAAFEALMRDLDLWDALDPATRQRLLGNAQVFFTYETPLLQSYGPDDALLGANRVPVQVGAGEGTPPVFREMAEWLASRLNVRVEKYPGGHAAASNHPDEVARVIRPFLLLHAGNRQHLANRMPQSGHS